MELTRRNFIKIAAAVPVVLIAGISAFGLIGDTYWMAPGEVLSGVHSPPWARIVMADDCQILRSYFQDTTLEVAGTRCLIVGNMLHSKSHRPAFSLAKAA